MLHRIRFTIPDKRISYHHIKGLAISIEKELAAAETALKNANEGKAHVCTRQAVALGDDAWLTRWAGITWRGAAMAHLRRIQQ